MRVLAGGPARETASAMFELHKLGLEAQRGGAEKAAIRGSPSSVSSSLDVTVHHELVEDIGGARWHHEKIERVARARQDMMRKVHWGLDGDPIDAFDALLMVDTDVVLGPGVLARMLAVDAPVVYGVFWTHCNWGNVPGIDVWPQVWDRHSYRFTQECWDALTAEGVNEVPVLGGGACTLIRGLGFESHYWPLLESLTAYDDMMCGEDRTYNLGLECRGIRQVALTGMPIVHLYTPEHRTPDKLALARQMVGLDMHEALANSLRT